LGVFRVQHEKRAGETVAWEGGAHGGDGRGSAISRSIDEVVSAIESSRGRPPTAGETGIPTSTTFQPHTIMSDSDQKIQLHVTHTLLFQGHQTLSQGSNPA
jgi:hypothetical protein